LSIISSNTTTASILSPLSKMTGTKNKPEKGDDLTKAVCCISPEMCHCYFCKSLDDSWTIIKEDEDGWCIMFPNEEMIT
jgi:hypothetical protein